MTYTTARHWSFVAFSSLLITLLAWSTANSAPAFIVSVTPSSHSVSFKAQSQSSLNLHVAVFALSGKRIFDSTPQTTKSLSWPLTDSQGRRLANGVYFYVATIQTAGALQRQVGKLVIQSGRLLASAQKATVIPLGTGNGAPTGAHYNLNIIGVPKDKTADMTGTNGHVIFVPLYGNAKIFLQAGPDFLVLDANGTDSNGASFQLPNPDPTGTGVTTYSVYARALGTPGGSSILTTCATDPSTGELLCSTENLVSVRNTGKSSFDNVSKQLLTIVIVVDPTTNPGLAACLHISSTTTVRLPLFDPCLQSFLWDYDNNGLKLLQLRFYPVPTTVGTTP
ncbi:hypothetical protein HY230_01025 [Candidatus Acetothermia bacterium]|nr:hypothetical protein [Candidatus Acetothermia bacterium]